MKAIFLLILLVVMLVPRLAAAEPCVNGYSQGAACSHIESLGNLTPTEMGGSGEVANDIWGWTDPLNGDEYAIVGMQDGTAFVRLAADGAPLFLGRLPASDGDSPISKRAAAEKSCHDELCSSENSAWRDVKVLDRYAYIVSEAIGHGLQIFDLHDLRALDPAAPDLALEVAGFYEGIGHAHNIFINEDSARAYVVGHDNSSANVAGGLHVLDLADPVNPVLLAELSGDGYTHDVQCVNYAGPDSDIAANSELCFASNEDTLTVWDVTDPQNAAILSRTAYSDAAYTHQGWLAPNHEYFYLNDELDEQRTGTRTHLRAFDVRNVDAPQIAAHYYAPTLAIDHNNYAYGRWLYQSNYTAGLRILDVLDPTAPVEAAYFDPLASDEAIFAGTWSNFLFPSGRIAFSDIRGGVYVVQPTLSETTAAPDLTVALQVEATGAAGGVIDGSMSLDSSAAADASDVLVTIHLPVDATFVEVSEPEGWTCTGESDGRVVRCRAAIFAAGSSATFELSMTSAVGGDVDTIAMAYANEADAAPADNLDVATTDFAAPLAPTRPGGNGGGGSIGWLLAGLLLLAGLRTRGVRR